VSRSHTPGWIQRFARALGDTTFVPCGSVGFKVGLLLFGEADVYVHKTGLNEWDTCAPEVVARAAGFCVSRIDGSPQTYNRPDPRNDEIVVCRPWLLERVLGALAARE
jgi:3'(2'), 5'-bisphosphate nucleotidase